MGVHFPDRPMAQLKQKLAAEIKRVIVHTRPTPRNRSEVTQRFEELWPYICAAHYDLGWSWMRVRDRLDSWMTRIILSVPIDLDVENAKARWVRRPHPKMREELEGAGGHRPSTQILVPGKPKT